MLQRFAKSDKKSGPVLLAAVLIFSAPGHPPDTLGKTELQILRIGQERWGGKRDDNKPSYIATHEL